MTLHSLSEIETRVAELLDENLEILAERTAYADPGTSLTGLVRRLLPDAARITLSTLPTSRLSDALSDWPPAISFVSDSKAITPLPRRFLRLLFFRMSDWEGGVTAPLAAGSEERQLRAPAPNRLRMHRLRPAVALTRSDGIPALEVFATSYGASVAEAAYIEAPEVTEQGIRLPDGTVHDVCTKLSEMISLITTHN